MTRPMPTTTPGPVAGTTTIPAPAATTAMTIPGLEAETTIPAPAATTEVARVWAGTWHDEGVDDRALVEATLAGDRQAFGAFVERETRTVYRACLRILGRPHDAEDVTPGELRGSLSSHRDLSR